MRDLHSASRPLHLNLTVRLQGRHPSTDVETSWPSVKRQHIFFVGRSASAKFVLLGLRGVGFGGPVCNDSLGCQKAEAKELRNLFRAEVGPVYIYIY